MVKQTISDAWLNGAMGQYLLAAERSFFQAALHNHRQQSLLYLADIDVGLPDFANNALLSIVQRSKQNKNNTYLTTDVLATADNTLPWANDSFDCLLLPHTLDLTTQPQLLLPEIMRIVQPQGKIILTGFNPYSLWRWHRQDFPDVRQGIPLPKLKQWLANLGAHIDEGRFINYLPPVNNQKVISAWHFMEAAGNRWWPQGAAVYALVLSKQVLCTPTLLDETQYLEEHNLNNKLILGVAKKYAK